MGADSAEASRRGARRSHTTQYFAPDTRAGARLTGSVSEALGRLTEELRTNVLRSGVYAGAKLLYEELLTRTPQGPSGNLRAAIYHWHDDKQSTDGRQVYAVGVNKRKAPHWALVEYGHWRRNLISPIDAADAPKYGKAAFRAADGRWYVGRKQLLPAPVWTPGTPYLRPTADKLPAAMQAIRARITQRLREVRIQGAP